MECLAKPMPSGEAIPWDAALTLAEISSFAYSDPDEQTKQLRGLGASDVRPIVKGSSHGVVASTDKVVVVAFRGTKDAADWLTDAQFIRTPNRRRQDAQRILRCDERDISGHI
jgi:hypothetical protein